MPRRGPIDGRGDHDASLLVMFVLSRASVVGIVYVAVLTPRSALRKSLRAALTVSEPDAERLIGYRLRNRDEYEQRLDANVVLRAD